MNYGLNLSKEREEQSEQDWVFGATGLKCLAEIPEEEREGFLPKGELQNIGEEKMDCASRAPLNILETKFNWLIKNKKLSFANEVWLKEKGYIVNDKIEFSDAFVAINSGTTREGNSLRSPLDAIRKQGLIPKSVLPQAQTWEEHHDPNRITGVIRLLGEEFAQRFFINYEKVYEKDYGELLKKDMIIVAGYAWPNPVNAEYPKTDNNPNHAFVAYKRPRYFIFDNYQEVAGDFIKKLAENFDLLDYGYRILVNREMVTPQKRSWLGRAVSYWWGTIWA